jgi:hypothetical protein
VNVRRLLVLGAITVAAGTTTAFAATLSVGSWHVWSGSQTLTKGTCTLTGTSSTTDTYVDERFSTSSFGGGTTMLVGPRSSQRKWALVRFDLSSCGIPSTGGADSATLSVRITTAPGSSRTIDVDPVLTAWSGTSTWNDAQTFSYGSTGSFTTGTTSNVTKSVTVTGDVDDLIKNGTANYGWRLSDAGGSANLTTTFGTSQNGTAANRPQLVINYEK